VQEHYATPAASAVQADCATPEVSAASAALADCAALADYVALADCATPEVSAASAAPVTCGAYAALAVYAASVEAHGNSMNYHARHTQVVGLTFRRLTRETTSAFSSFPPLVHFHYEKSIRKRQHNSMHKATVLHHRNSGSNPRRLRSTLQEYFH